jgi:thiol:disulfide interchange protein
VTMTNASVRRVLSRLLLVLFFGLAATRASAQVEASLIYAGGTADKGGVVVAIELRHAPGWHTYWLNPGTGQATNAEWDLPNEWRAGPINWPVPIVIRGSDGAPTGHGYDDIVYLPVRLSTANGAVSGGTVPVKATVKWLMCEAERCIPGTADLVLQVKPDAAADSAVTSALRAQAMPFQNPTARFAASRLGKEISVDVSGIGEMRDPHFFPANGMIRHDAHQIFEADNDKLKLTMTIDEYWEGATNHVSGVLAFTDAAGRYRGVLIDTPIDGGVAAAAPASSAATDVATASSPLLLLFAFLGGLILNLMPCVLPVLSIKALSLAQGAAGDARREGLHYAAGVMATFALVGGIMLILRSTLGGIGWGFQLQNPYVVLALALLMAGIGFNLVGLLEVGLGAGGIGQGLISRAGKAKSFLTGALAVVVATPCTAPFMAAALGAALLASAPVALLIFLSLGLGMAAPFLLLALWPKARSILPKPGAWMVSFRTLLAFPMFATAIWLLWVLGSQRGPDAMALGLIAVTALALLFWALGKARDRGTIGWRLLAIAAVALLGFSAWLLPQDAPAASGREGTGALYSEDAFSPQALDAALSSGDPVFAYFTADWCVTCKLNERVALHTSETAALLKAKKVHVLVGDWTSQNADITAILAQYGRAGVPLYLYFPPGAGKGDAEILPQLLTNDIVSEALR